MKNFTKQITNKTLFKPTRWILLALMLLLGTSGAWAAIIYFDNTNTKWTNVYLWIGKSQENGADSNYSEGNRKMKQKCGNIYYCEVNWDGATEISFTNTEWGGEANTICHRYGWFNGEATHIYKTSVTDANGKVFKPSATKSVAKQNGDYCKCTIGNGQQNNKNFYEFASVINYSDALCCSAPSAANYSVPTTYYTTGADLSTTIRNDIQVSNGAGAVLDMICKQNGTTKTPQNAGTYTVHVKTDATNTICSSGDAYLEIGTITIHQSYTQADGIYYFDNSACQWDKVFLHIGNQTNSSGQTGNASYWTYKNDASFLVAGTRHLYKRQFTQNNYTAWFWSSNGTKASETDIVENYNNLNSGANEITTLTYSGLTNNHVYRADAKNVVSDKGQYGVYTITLKIEGPGNVTVKNNADVTLFDNVSAATQTQNNVGYLTYLKNINATPSYGYALTSIKVDDVDYTDAYRSGEDTQDGYDLTGNVTITVKFDCTTPTALREIDPTKVSYVDCDKVNIVLNSAITAPANGMLVRYEGTKTSSQITAPTDGVTYKLDDKIGEGVVVAYGKTSASEFLNMPMPDVTKVYTFALYEYRDDCKLYVQAGDVFTTAPRAPVVITADPTNVNGKTATLGGTYVQQGSGTGIDHYGIVWTEKPAGSTLQDINKAGTVGVGASFTVDVTFDVNGTYKYKAFINSNVSGACEIGYGEEKSINDVIVCINPQFTLSNNNVPYTGSAQKPTITGDVTPTTIKYNNEALPNGPTSVGTYSVKVSASETSDYCAVTDLEIGTFTINKVDQPTLTLAGVDATYCTLPVKAIELSVKGGAGEGTVTYSIVNEGTTAEATINGNQLSITKGGTLKLKATKAADNNYNQAESEVVTVTIYEDIEAGSISASKTEVCEGAAVTLTLTGNTEGTKITWTASDCDSPAESVANDATQFITNVSKQTCYMVEVSREDAGCPVKIAQTNSVQINTVAPSAISLRATEEAACLGTSVNLTSKVTDATGEVTWYTDQAGTQPVDNTNVTVNGDATYYAKATNGVCPATDAVAYTITAKGATISRTPAGDIHPYEVTTFTASNEATWELTNNPSSGTPYASSSAGSTPSDPTECANLLPSLSEGGHYFAPGWSPNNNYSAELTNYDVRIVTNESTYGRWQAQFKYNLANDLQIQAGVNYTFSFTIQSNIATTTNALVKLMQDDNNYLLTEEFSLQANVPYNFTYTGTANLALRSLLFDFGGNGAFEVTITNIKLTEEECAGADADVIYSDSFVGKTTAYIQSNGQRAVFKGEAATGYEIKATADDCETTLQFNVVADPNNCE